MESRYLNISQIKHDNGKNINSQSYYPQVPLKNTDVYIITKSDDRFDLISLDFWGDKSYWWIIPIINNIECDSIFPPSGIQLRIPNNIEEVINLYNEENI